MKHVLYILLVGLMPSLSAQYKTNRQTSGGALELDDFLIEAKTENNFLDVTSAGVSGRTKAKPKVKLFPFDAAEFYRQLNATMFGVGFNFSLANSSYGDYEYGCNHGQHIVINFVTMILYSVVCIIGLLGNTLVIYVVLRFSKMQTVTNIYILNLAIADESFLIGIPFLLYTMQNGSWQFGEYACKAYMVSTSITQFTSSIFLLIMSADRYIAVCHPISSPRYRTPIVSQLVSLFAWLTSVFLMLPVILFANTVENGEHISCNIKWPEAQNSQSGTTFILYSLVLGFATPLIFILGFYCLVIRKLHTVGPKHKSKEKKRSHRKVTKLVLTVITVYILCWLPYWISQVALITSSPGKCASSLEITIFLLVGCLGYSNSAMNPILYAFLSDNFKKSFMKACTCATRKDINNQLQLENSMFPKFRKSKTEKALSRNKNNQKNSILNNLNCKTKHLITSSADTKSKTCTTNATTIESSNNIPICTSAKIKHLQEASHSSSSCNNHQQLSSPLIPYQAGVTENSNLESSSDYSDSSTKPPVLHTDL